MMCWSIYNTLFYSERFGYFLYNALSNTFIEVDRHHYDFLEQTQKNPQLINSGIDDQFLALLQEKKVIVKAGEERHLLIERQYKRDTLCFDNTHLDLSICPTLGCNFRCPYCFEHTQQDMTIMNAATVNQLSAFIKSFIKIRSLSITWYGGEPTINPAFNVVHEITKRIKKLDIDFREAGLVTNAYLLGEEKINQLNELNIKTVQITIDGPQEIHDSRRVLDSGRPTFQQIINNIDTLMNSSFNGSCNIRVNLDQTNLSSFFDIRKYLLKRFDGKNLYVYAGHVDTSPDHRYDKNCNLCAEEWTEFTVEQFRHLKISPGKGIYPLGTIFNICSANTRNSFVIGPEGELYKCWEDVGNKRMVVGSIFQDDHISNAELVALYSIGTDPYLDKECLECKIFPICGGGCANRRLRAKHFNEDGLKYCSLYKDNIVKYLMEYYDAFLTKEMCAQVLSVELEPWNKKGYRIIHS